MLYRHFQLCESQQQSPTWFLDGLAETERGIDTTQTLPVHHWELTYVEYTNFFYARGRLAKNLEGNDSWL